MFSAETVFEQIGGIRRLQIMTGAYNFTRNDADKNVTFRFKASRKVNLCRITLDPSDTYTMTFMRVRGMSVKTVAEISDVFCDQLIPIFESNTGLYLTL